MLKLSYLFQLGHGELNNHLNANKRKLYFYLFMDQVFLFKMIYLTIFKYVSVHGYVHMCPGVLGGQKSGAVVTRGCELPGTGSGN